jgi:hypothetical protein
MTTARLRARAVRKGLYYTKANGYAQTSQRYAYEKKCSTSIYRSIIHDTEPEGGRGRKGNRPETSSSVPESRHSRCTPSGLLTPHAHTSG